MEQAPNTAGFRDAVTRARVIVCNLARVANVWVACHAHRSPKYLPILLLFITNRCNLRCKMCGVWEHDDPDHGPEELTTEEWKTVLDSAARLGTILVSITGGEALLRPDIFEIIRYGRRLGMAIHLCTNGTVMNERIIRELRDSGVDTVSISLESPIPEIHNSLRGDGTFQRVVQSIRQLRELAPEIQVGINYLITAENYKNMADMVPFAESLGVHQIKFAPIHTNLQHRNKRIEEFEGLVFKEKDLDNLDLEVKKLMAAAKKTRLQTASTMFLAGIISLYDQPRRFRCYAGYAACSINPVGMVTPCCDMDGTISVRDKPLEEIWRSKGFLALRQRVHHCERACWDTTNAELSLRLSVRSLLRQIGQTWRDVGFYFGKGRS